MVASSAVPTAPAAPAWRQFSFFDITPVKDSQDLGSSPDVFKSPAELATVASSSAGVLLADFHGIIHILKRDFEASQNWTAYAGGRVTHMVEHRGILVTLGEEESTRFPVLKIWDIAHTDRASGSPALLRSLKVQHGGTPHPVTTIALSTSLSHLAIGLGDGTVLLYRHLDQSLFSGSSSLTALPKPKTIHESPTEPITGLGFREPNPTTSEEKTEKEQTHLFIVTTNRVLSCVVSGKGSGGAPAVVDEVGCSLGCAVMDHHSREMVVARDEAIYLCGPEGRGACFAIEWPKISVRSYRNYLIIVSPTFFPSASSASATVRNYIARAPNPTAASQMDVSKVTIFDLENKFIAFSENFREGAREIICEWGQIYVLSNDGKLFHLQEKSTTEKLDHLYGKSLFLLAINLARSQGVDESRIADIHRRYGDHLYVKGDYDGAMQQFIKTIGHLQPSYVIRKFLDAQRIHNLTMYLQELHTRGLANSDHTTLLLNTYTKLKDVSRLDSFIKSGSGSGEGAEGKDGPPFDLETVIRVCRQAGYFDHAVYLAKAHRRHLDYLQIQIEDAGNYHEALLYLRKLGPEAAEENLTRYGRSMLAKLPDETTQLLIDLCSGIDMEDTPDQPEPELTKPIERPNQGGASYLTRLAGNRASMLFTGDMNLNFTSPPPPVSNPSSDSTEREKENKTGQHLRRSIFDAGRLETITDSPSTATADIPLTKSRFNPKRPSPKQYFAHFVDHTDQFIKFLEAVAWNRWGQMVTTDRSSSARGDGASSSRDSVSDDAAEKRDQTAIWNTLLELYLTVSATTTNTALATTSRNKALQLLNHHDTLPYDPIHALIVCSTRSFMDGLVLLWEQMGMYEDVLRYWMDRENEGDVETVSGERPSVRVLHYLKLYGTTHPYLYPLVLRFLTSTPALLNRHTTDLTKILAHIDKERIMPPLGVIQVLSRNDVASVGLVKQWLIGRITESREEIDADRQLINSYRSETKTKLQEITDLTDSTKALVFHVTRCSACSGQLDLPAVHFMCKHSYHQRCLADHETECPNCAQAHGVIRELGRENERFANQHDVFLHNVEEGGFSGVAAAFGRGGLMEVGKVEPVAPARR